MHVIHMYLYQYYTKTYTEIVVNIFFIFLTKIPFEINTNEQTVFFLSNGVENHITGIVTFNIEIVTISAILAG